MTESSQYGLLTRIRVRISGLVDRPADVCPFLLPSADWTRLCLTLPAADYQALCLALQRLLATQHACSHSSPRW